MDAASLLMRPCAGVRIEGLNERYRGPRRTPDQGRVAHPRDAPEGRPDGAVLYLHGGGYVACSPRTHRPITSRLAHDTGLPVLAPRYRLAPEHPFPAPLEDAVTAYRWLLARGVPASGIVIAGDSVGGHLAAVLAGEICRLDLRPPPGSRCSPPGST